MTQTTIDKNHEHLLLVNKIYRKILGRKELCFLDVEEMIKEAKSFIEFLEDSTLQEKFLQEEIKTLLKQFKQYGYEI